MVIEYLLKKVLFSQPELKEKKNIGIQIPKEFLEQWVAQGLGLKVIGAGNYPVDVYSEDSNYAIDVKFVSTNTDKENNLLDSLSNESSLAQKFKGVGKNLDTLFKDKKFEDILKKWVDILENKISKVKNDLSKDIIYYFIFTRASNKIHLCVCEFLNKNLDNLSVNPKSNEKSLFVDNFIKSNYGEVKIYKSKKRMELRLKAKQLELDNKLFNFEFNNFNEDIKDLRTFENKENFNEFIKNKINNIFFNPKL